jgi:hypothetical protein
MSRLNLIILIVLLVINILARHVFVYSDNWYFVGDAVSWVLAFILIARLTFGTTRMVAVGIAFLTVSNLMDELFFNPQVFGWNEYVFITFVGLWLYLNLRKCRTSKSRL